MCSKKCDKTLPQKKIVRGRQAQKFPLPCGERDSHMEKEIPHGERDPPHGEKGPHVERNDCMPT